MRVLGVDGYRGGWVGIELVDGLYAAARVGRTLADVVGEVGGWLAVAVDMPLGLVDEGWRRADLDAAVFLRPRGGSVFRVPPRAVWAETEFPAAVRRCRELTGGSGFSIQAFRLGPKLLEANTYRDSGAAELYEVHPEVSFRELAGRPLGGTKKTWAGQAERRRLLAGAGVEVPDELGPAGAAPPDDVLDAAAVAWTAHRIAQGQARRFPASPQVDDRGRPIAIWY